MDTFNELYILFEKKIIIIIIDCVKLDYCNLTIWINIVICYYFIQSNFFPLLHNTFIALLLSSIYSNPRLDCGYSCDLGDIELYANLQKFDTQSSYCSLQHANVRSIN